jgi:hypothetical protein
LGAAVVTHDTISFLGTKANNFGHAVAQDIAAEGAANREAWQRAAANGRGVLSDLSDITGPIQRSVDSTISTVTAVASVPKHVEEAAAAKVNRFAQTRPHLNNLLEYAGPLAVVGAGLVLGSNPNKLAEAKATPSHSGKAPDLAMTAHGARHDAAASHSTIDSAQAQHGARHQVATSHSAPADHPGHQAAPQSREVKIAAGDSYWSEARKVEGSHASNEAVRQLTVKLEKSNEGKMLQPGDIIHFS